MSETEILLAGNRSVVAKPSGKKTRTKQAQANSRWRGALLGMHGSLLFGWAIDCEQVDARVVVELCLNGQAFASVIADVAQQGLPDFGQSDPCHGFVAHLGSLSKNAAGILSVRIANLEWPLSGQVDLAQPHLPERASRNFVFSDGALRLLGWVLDEQDQQRQLKVQAWHKQELLCQTIADLEHPSLRGYSIGRHGFQLELPLHLADGKTRDIRVLDEDGVELAGSPIRLCFYASGLRDLPIAKLDSADNALLNSLMSTYQGLLPRGLAWQYYPAWRDKYDCGNSLPLAQWDYGPKLAVIIYGDDHAQRAEQSLQAQLGLRCQIFHAGEQLASVLKQVKSGKFDAIAFLRGGDSLRPSALAWCWHAMQSSSAQIVYTDSEVQQAQVVRPWLKPAWNAEYALATDFTLELMLFRSSLLPTLRSKQISAVDIAWQVLAAAWPSAQNTIVHLPHVLYCFHSPLSASERSARLHAAQQALRKLEPQARLDVLSPAADATPNSLWFADMQARQLQRSLSAQARQLKISLIIPTRDQAAMLQRCIESLHQYTNWPNLEILVVDNDSIEERTLLYFEQLQQSGVRIVPAPGRFNFSRINNLAVTQATGEIICLINNDVEALHEGWLEAMLSHLMQPEVAAVGAKLLWPNGMVQHGGVLLGVGNVAGHFGNLLSEHDAGDHARNQVSMQVSAVTAACLMLRKADYEAVGGLDEHAFPVAFNDVDLCLKLRATGKQIIWCAQARLLHAESVSRGSEDTPQKRQRAQREIDQLRRRWGHVLLQDPAYHPSLNLDAHGHAFSGLALPPRPRLPRLSTIDQMANDIQSCQSPEM